MCMCAEYLAKGKQDTEDNWVIGDRAGESFCGYHLYPLNVVLCMHFYSKDKLKGWRKPPEETEP